MIIHGQARKTVMASVLSIALTMIFILPFCGWMFQCGCGFLWSSYAQCNIHQAGLPHCPWCVERHPFLMTLPFLFIFGAQVTVIRYFNHHYDLHLVVLLIIGLLTFLIAGIVTGYGFKVVDGYPYFFVK